MVAERSRSVATACISDSSSSASDATCANNSSLSVNNPADLPAYTFTNAEVGAVVGPGRLRFIAYNLFNNESGDRSLIGQGYPLALNSYAPSFAYAPYVGAAATTAYVLAPRRFEIYYQILPHLKGSTR